MFLTVSLQLKWVLFHEVPERSRKNTLKQYFVWKVIPMIQIKMEAFRHYMFSYIYI